MKFRIKIFTHNDGTKYFFPQKKVFWGWADLIYGYTSTPTNRNDALQFIDNTYNCQVKSIEFEYINK